MKTVKTLLSAICICLCIAGTRAETPLLGVSENGRFFVERHSGKPVFLLCDTGWNLAALTKTEIDTYIKSRVDNGFNTIMFTLNFEPQAEAENAYGERVYIGEDSTELNHKALEHIDYIVERCSDNGLYAMIYSMWGGNKSGTMNRYTAEQLYKIGVSVGKYFGGRDNVILVTGGETTPHFVDVERVNAIGKGLNEGCGNQNLVAVHPVSEHSTSDFFAESEWLDFYMIQGKSGITGNGYDYERIITKDYNLDMVKPTMLGEHRYESGVSEDDFIQRAPLYISVFAGAGAYGYGHNALWQMTPHTALPWMLRGWAPGTDKWDKVLYTKASGQLQHIKKLLYAYPYLKRIPDQNILLSKQVEGINNRVQVTRDGTMGHNDATYIMAYAASPQEMILNTSVINAKRINIRMFDPRTGKAKITGSRIRNNGTLTIPAVSDGKDWVIVIDDASKKYNLP